MAMFQVNNKWENNICIIYLGGSEKGRTAQVRHQIHKHTQLNNWTMEKEKREREKNTKLEKNQPQTQRKINNFFISK